MDRFRGKVALITGGSSGIGRETAVRLAARGAHVAIAARDPEPLAETAARLGAVGPEPLAVPTDVTDRDQCRRAVEATVQKFGRLDILVCSAGLSMRTYFAGSDLTAMERVIRVNLFGTLYATFFAVPHVKQSRGSLVAVSSLTGRRGIPSYAVYGASKFGVQGLYDSLRLELRRDGVHVGVVSPGFVDTPLRSRVLGPDGAVWADPPSPPFRVWTTEQCVDRVMQLLTYRQTQALMPWWVGPMLWLDQIVGGWVGDRILVRNFPPESREGDDR